MSDEPTTEPTEPVEEPTDEEAFGDKDPDDAVDTEDDNTVTVEEPTEEE